MLATSTSSECASDVPPAHFVLSTSDFGRRLAGVQSQQRVQQDRHVRHAVGREAVQVPLGAAVLHVDAPEGRTHRGRPHETLQGESLAITIKNQQT